MKLKTIEFSFENCETMKIDGEYVGKMLIENIKTRIQKHHSSILKHHICEHFSISLNSAADVAHNPFDLEEWKTTKFNRIQEHKDIVAVYLYYSDGSDEEYYVNWEGDSDYTNECQQMCKNAYGDLYILINRNKKIEDVFDIKSEEKHRNFLWNLNK